MALPGSPIYSTTYVKISKKDINGDDVTSTLENLLYFTLKYNDIGSVQFVIEDKTEYTDYFLFKIKLTAYNQSSNINTLVSSSDNNILNYKVSASNTTNQTGSILYFPTISYDDLGYLSSSNGYYTLGNTPNIPLIISASATLYSDNGTLGTEIRLYRRLTGGSLQGISGFSYTQASLAPSSSTTLYLSGSLTPIKGETYVVSISDDSPSDTDITASFASLIVTQSVRPNIGVSGSGDDLIIVTSGIEEENPLYGNADLIVLNPRYITLDYTVYTLPEDEFQLVLSGFGTYSTVKQYNYEANRIIIPRYKGSRSNSPDFNQNTTDGGLGLAPNVERTTPYFLYFNRVFNSAPILKDKATLELKYLIDENGEAYNLNTQVPIYQNLIGSFEVGKKAYASFLNNENTIYNNTQSILLSGQFYQPVLYNLSSSTTLDWSPNLDFINLDGSSGSGAPSFNSTVVASNELGVNNNNQNTITYLGSHGSLNGTQVISNGSWGGSSPLPVNSSTFTFHVDAESPVTVIMSGQTYAGASTGLALYSIIFKNGTDPFSNIVAIQYSNNPGSDSTGGYYVSYNFIPQAGDTLTFAFQKLTPSNEYSQIIRQPTIQIITSGLIAPSPSTPYWHLLPNNSLVITASEALTECYQQFIQKPIPSSGFTDSKKIFEIFPGDEFRFEYQEGQNNVFKVVKAEVTSSATFAPQRLYVTFDKLIPTASTPGDTGNLNLNHFTIRRKSIDVGNGITLDAPYTTNANEGFLFPEYPTDKIKNNLPNIVAELRQKGLIQ